MRIKLALLILAVASLACSVTHLPDKDVVEVCASVFVTPLGLGLLWGWDAFVRH